MEIENLLNSTGLDYTRRSCRLQCEQTQTLLPLISRQNNWCWLPIGWRVSHLYSVDRVGGDIPALIIQLYVKTASVLIRTCQLQSKLLPG